MRFNSLIYVVFLTLACVLHYILPQKSRWRLLLVFSYYFYMSWNAKLVFLILFTTRVSFIGARIIEKTDSQSGKKASLIVSVGLCLATLFFFKYFNFFTQTVNGLFGFIGVTSLIPRFDIILPVGISFYTFQTLSYVIDVYKGQMKAQTHFGKYALYVSFFPQLVAGPIERAVNLMPQFEEEHFFDRSEFTKGMRKILVGMSKKIVIADTLAVYVNNVYNNLEGKSGIALIIATVFFGIQIYCDFSGYSDIAIGSARLLGFRLMENFKAPYLSKSVKEFWRKWHISLTSWFTDYIYIPLGGSRCSQPKHLANLMIVFLFSGLWHGANYTFVLWGLYHGLLLCAGVFILPVVEKFCKKLSGIKLKLFTAFRMLVTFGLVNIGWIIFRANSISDLVYILTHLVKGLNIFRLSVYLSIMEISVKMFAISVCLIVSLFVYDYLCTEKKTDIDKWNPIARYALYYAACVIIIVTLMYKPAGAVAEFIYFQF